VAGDAAAAVDRTALGEVGADVEMYEANPEIWRKKEDRVTGKQNTKKKVKRFQI
jgi:hypothetical protein